MGSEQIPDWQWVEGFGELFGSCQLRRGESAVVVRTDASLDGAVDAARLALQSLGLEVLELHLPAGIDPVGEVAGNPATWAGLAAAGFVVDCTPEGLGPSTALTSLLAAGARGVSIALEPPSLVCELMVGNDLHGAAARCADALRNATEMTITSPAGTELSVALAEAVIAPDDGLAVGPGSWTRWPGGSVALELAKGAISGAVTFAPGDLISGTGSLVTTKVTMTLEAGRVASVAGAGLDTAMLAWLIEAAGSGACLVPRLRVGINSRARWERAGLRPGGPSLAEYTAAAGMLSLDLTCGDHQGMAVTVALRRCNISADFHAVVADGALT